MSRHLDDLTTEMRARAFEWLARLAEQGVPVLIVDTLRTAEEHEANLRSGASASTVSYHLPRHLRVIGLPLGHPDAGKSDAMDVCPYEQFALHGPDKLQWKADDPAWRIVQECCERAGLESGRRWTKPHDPGHGQLHRRYWAI